MLRKLRKLLLLLLLIGASVCLWRGGYQRLRFEAARRLGELAAASVKPDPNEPFAPRALPLASGCSRHTITAAPPSESTTLEAPPAQITAPVNIVLREGSEYYVCNYNDLYLVNLEARRAWKIPPPKDLPSKWVPTALAYDSADKKLYVATYTGGNVLVLDASERLQVRLASILVHPELKGPEGVALTPDGQYVAVADYDGHAAMLFSKSGELKWRNTARGCHGIACVRRPDGKQFIFATALEETTLYKYDLEGNIVLKNPRSGWYERDHCMYPTALFARPDGILALTDAFRGQVSFLDEDLATYGTLGGNGPGPAFFNNPYACCFDARGDHLLVADTYKDRIVEVSLQTKQITRIFPLADPVVPPAHLPRWFHRKSELNSLACTMSPPGLNLASTEAFGRNYDHGVDVNTTVTLPLPRFAGFMNKRFGKEWHPRINGLVSAANPDIFLSTDINPLFAESNFRFVFARNYENHAYLLLLSPQCKEVLVCGRGATIPISLRKDTWLIGDTLVGQDFVLPASQVVELGARRIHGFFDRLACQTPLAAMHAVAFPHMTDEEFTAAISQAMRTPEGIAFAKACAEADDTAGQCAAAMEYLKFCKRQKSYQLQEVLFAEMILSAQKVE